MINFLKYRPQALVFSCLIIGSFIAGALYKRVTTGQVFQYSVDFTGGTQVLLGFSKPTTGEAVARTLASKGIDGVVTRDFSDREILVRMKGYEYDTKGLSGRVKTMLEEAYPGNEVTIKQTDAVGVSVGKSLTWNSVYMVLLALFIMLLYIWFRFRLFSFAIGNVISLGHDVIVVLSFVMWFNYEISLNILSAILFILGYSINDTIVIFSRIRDNIKKFSGTKTIEEIVNISLNETLRRTILTVFATALVVVALAIFGGELLRTLSLALLVGMVFGTYSSIYIASPAMLLFYKKDHN
ncbi:MAG: Protein translocase subunit SecF [candidate division TM6 bacterium GW2011_GWE2_41_16]|nr:MAG: Protein translocase subunit SecF [candidate division TM6 bacterium GW2011_GWE2_41_16]